MTNEELVDAVQNDDNKKDPMLALWEQNRGLIGEVVKRYLSYMELEDLEQEGYIGLYKAAINYKPDKGANFATYAKITIECHFIRSIENHGYIVRIPIHLRQCIQQYKRLLARYKKEYGASFPDDSYICNELGIKKEKLELIKHVLIDFDGMKSLNTPVGEEKEDGFEYLDIVPGVQDIEEDIDKRVDREILKQDIKKALAESKLKYPQVVPWLYRDGKTLKECGEMIGITAESVRKHKEAALDYFRNCKHTPKLKAYHEVYLGCPRIQNVSVATFNRTWTSATEKEALFRLERCLKRNNICY